MKNILITGSSGFIGARLVQHLKNKGVRVFEFDMPDFDMTNADCFKPFLDEDITHVCHLAGKTFVPDSWKDPAEFYRINLLGTINVLEYCRQKNARLTHLSSYLYGEPEYLPIDENHILKANNPYSHSKLLADNACRFYLNNYGLNVSILRAFNVYGPNQNEIFLIPKIIRKIKNENMNSIDVLDLTPKRDFIYIDDLIEAIDSSLIGPEGVYNVGSGYSVSVEELIKTIQEVTGIYKEYYSCNETRPNEIFDLYADISKIKRHLHWEPKIDLKSGLSLCIQQFMD